jgi:hypothetical protein
MVGGVVRQLMRHDEGDFVVAAGIFQDAPVDHHPPVLPGIGIHLPAAGGRDVPVAGADAELDAEVAGGRTKPVGDAADGARRLPFRQLAA